MNVVIMSRAVTSDSETFYCCSPQGSVPEDSIVHLSAAPGKIRSPLLLVFIVQIEAAPQRLRLSCIHMSSAPAHINILDPYTGRDWNNDQTDPWISLKSSPSDRPLNQAVQRWQNIAFSPLRNCRNFLSIFQMIPLWSGKVLLLDAACSTLFTWCSISAKTFSKATILYKSNQCYQHYLHHCKIYQ